MLTPCCPAFSSGSAAFSSTWSRSAAGRRRRSPRPTPYTASKFGLRGFSASLRQELRRSPHIHVCAVFPAMVDTPGFVHGANVSGRTLDPGPMLYAPEEVAETLVHVVRHPP